MKLAILLVIAAVIPAFFVLLFMNQARVRRRREQGNKLAEGQLPSEESNRK